MTKTKNVKALLELEERKKETEELVNICSTLTRLEKEIQSHPYKSIANIEKYKKLANEYNETIETLKRSKKLTKTLQKRLDKIRGV